MLYVDWIFRLEEVYTKCLSIVYIFGTDCEKHQARINLLHDFVHMGGITDDSGPGSGLDPTITAYYRAFFSSTNRHPLAYQRFGELISELAELVQKKYPKAAPNLSRSIVYLLESETHGFASKSISSPAKVAMIEVLQQVVAALKEAKQAAA